MNEHPIEIGNGIALITPKKLEKKDVILFFKTVKAFGPEGNIQTISTSNNKGEPKNILVTERHYEDKVAYIISLRRPLVLGELSKINKALDEFIPNVEYDLTSLDNLHYDIKREDSVKVDANAYKKLCFELSKHNHDTWVASKVSNGWRYAPEFNLDNKTHPMLLAWDQLPPEYRRVDYNILNKVVEFMNNQGYAIVDKNSVDAELCLDFSKDLI